MPSTLAAMQLAVHLMRDVYGDWRAPDWVPKPMPSAEAGPHLSGQRRYLWVDAFGVLNFVALAAVSEGEEAQVHLAAAAHLIEAVHTCLGSPRSAELPMRPAADGSGYEGLRIGKVHARKQSDPGMELDGMYWHYLDKWIFALARYGRAASDPAAVRLGLRLVKQVHPRFLARTAAGEPLGLYWKMNADLTTISGRERAGPSGDAVSGLIAYIALDKTHHAVGPKNAAGIGDEIADLTAVSSMYAKGGGFQMATSDPLGFGLQYWEAQFFSPELSGALRGALRRAAGSALHLRHLALPFRFYGALLGARLSEDPALEEQAQQMLEIAVQQEMSSKFGESEHSCINKVMLASALLPGAFRRRPDEVVELH